MLVVNLLAKNLPLNQNLQMFSFFMRQTWKTQLASFNAFLRVYPSLIKKDCVINMHSLAVYVKEWLPLPRDCPLQNSDGSYVFYWLYQCQCFISFSLSITIFFLSFLFSEFLIFVTHGQGYKVTVTFSTNIQVFGDCHDLPGELFFNFISQTTLLTLETFYLGSLTMQTVMFFWIYLSGKTSSGKMTKI